MSACSAVLLNKPQGLEKDQPWCAPLTPGCPVGLRSLPSLPTPVSCAGSAACFAAWAAASVCARVGSREPRLWPGPGRPRAASMLSPQPCIALVTPAPGWGWSQRPCVPAGAP